MRARRRDRDRDPGRGRAGAGRPETVTRRWRHAAVGLATAVGAGGMLLAYPAWYAVAGPRPLPHRVFPDVQYFGSTWRTLLLAADGP